MSGAIREAACMLLLAAQPKSQAIRVLMVKRYSKARFMSNLYVFPGGCRDAADGANSDLSTFMRTAMRELQEETGLSLNASSKVVAAKDAAPESMPDANVLVPFARWVTPKQEKYRYDTWFFAAEALTASEGGELPPLVLDPNEITDAQWVRPETALRWHVDAEKTFRVPPPTHLLLQELCLHETPQDFLTYYRKKNYAADPTKIPINEPTLEMEGGRISKMHLARGAVPAELTPGDKSSFPQWNREGGDGDEKNASWKLRDVPVVVGQVHAPRA